MFGFLKRENLPTKAKVEYIPLEDITAYEVAKCLEINMRLFNYYNNFSYDQIKQILEEYPDYITRHFTLQRNK